MLRVHLVHKVQLAGYEVPPWLLREILKTLQVAISPPAFEANTPLGRAWHGASRPCIGAEN